MKYELLFDMIKHQVDKPEENFVQGKLNLKPVQVESAIQKSLQAFVHTVASGSEVKSIQDFSGSSDLPQLTKDVFNVTSQTPTFDLGWQAAFKGVTLKKGQLSWEIATVSEATEFELTPEGAKCKISSFSGSKIIADIQKYSRGLGTTWETIEGNKLYKFVDNLDSMRSKLYGLWSLVHYGLLATAAATNQVAWQGVGTDKTIDRDLATLNEGASQLTRGTKDSGYGDTAQAVLLLYIDPKFKSRIGAAMSVTLDALVNSGGNGTPLNWKIQPIYTYSAEIPVNKGLLVLPGNKIQNAVYLQEMSFKEKSIETLNEIRTYWTAFGAVVADNDQCFELAFA